MVHNSYRQHTLFIDFLNCLLCDPLKNPLFPPDTTLCAGASRQKGQLIAHHIVFKMTYDCHNIILNFLGLTGKLSTCHASTWASWILACQRDGKGERVHSLVGCAASGVSHKKPTSFTLKQNMKLQKVAWPHMQGSACYKPSSVSIPVEPSSFHQCRPIQRTIMVIIEGEMAWIFWRHLGGKKNQKHSAISCLQNCPTPQHCTQKALSVVKLRNSAVSHWITIRAGRRVTNLSLGSHIRR